MTASISLGTFRGIPIGVNWSVFLIAGLIAWSLATRILPAQVLGLDPPAYWAAGSLVAILFFASLLGHELAHAIVARREGLRVEGITLWLLGGVARMNGDAPSPGQHLLPRSARPGARSYHDLIVDGEDVPHPRVVALDGDDRGRQDRGRRPLLQR